MALPRTLFTSESVTEGHPDKIADQISDGILDAILTDDPDGRVACETLVTTGTAFIAGEITTKTYVDIPKVVRETIRDVGYTRAKYGFDYQTCAVLSSIDKQSPDIAHGRRPGRRRRPGPHVRLRGARDRGADAAPDHPRAQAHPPPRRGPEIARARVASPRREEPGHGGVRGEPPGPCRRGRRLDPARRDGPDPRAARGDSRGGHQAGRPGGAPRRPDEVPHQSRRGGSSSAGRRATRG